MKKQYRLRKNWEFNNVLNSGKKNCIANKYLIVYYVKSNSFRAGITVPKKFANAVGRNLYKRQLRAIVHELNLYDLNYDFVLIVRKDFIETKYAVKKAAICKIFEKFRKNEKI
ncbi:ribonuclease P protein component [Mycoplasmopsis verecunda]|uniref:Ribonuclease P protein component n=1 Tax=Mycoplasmopsis verecunda TaxID=171291 RepID=A0A1T4LQ36_9BACT|nr:ribonuclease P protein component [Mycoplasmopsis verecunda]WPB54548.1 ribonuclease P protein component [Mycoplasmopsis verecunda]SJZ56830.1 ribonuclease P protein component [Mycoplasmopsis verecunda]